MVVVLVYAHVIVEIGVKAVDREFVYMVPDRFRKLIKVGSRVKVNFGKQLLEGFVLKLDNNGEKTEYFSKNGLRDYVDQKVKDKEIIDNRFYSKFKCIIHRQYDVSKRNRLKKLYKC